MGYLSADEVGSLLSKAPSHKWFTLFLTAIATGMRVSEIVAMKWQNVDWNSSK
jgi:integrase